MTGAERRSSSQPTFSDGPRLPNLPVNRWARPLLRFLRIESASGMVLLVCTLVALGFANSPWAKEFAALWKTHLRIGIGTWELDESLLHWINDALMTVFFFVVGLEIKREIVMGELRDPRRIALPVLAALGGMLVPAGIFWLLRGGQAGQSGWGIPMATDIAFVVGFLALLGKRVPWGLKVLLLSLAIADDIGAILVIALFYSSNVSLAALSWAAGGFGMAWLLNRIGVRAVSIYAVLGAGIWLAFLHSGIHPTVAGVLLGLLTPAVPLIGDQTLATMLGGLLDEWRQDRDPHEKHGVPPRLGELRFAAREARSPLERLETALHPWVAFGIMPVFALANAGVAIELGALGHPVSLAVAAGLVLGKPLGIVLFSWVGVRLGLARLPTGVNWSIMLGAGCLAGIGFTMSLFIAGLALDGELLAAGKFGTLIGSALSAVLGCVLLLAFLPKSPLGMRKSVPSQKLGGPA